MPTDGILTLGTSQDLVNGLYYTDSYGLAVSIILEPHECVQVEYFCIGQRMIIIGDHAEFFLLIIIDLADFSSIFAFADWTERELQRLDILVENTGMATPEYEQVEGRKRTWRFLSTGED